MLSSEISNLSYAAQLYLWKRRTLYIGKFEEPIAVSQAAATLVISLDEPFTFITEDMDIPVHTRSLILPAGCTVTLDTKSSLVANCNLDALGRDYFTLFSYAQNAHHKIGFGLSVEDLLVKCFLHLFCCEMDSQQACEYLESKLSPIDVSSVNEYVVDARIEKAIDLIQSRVNDNMSGEALAEAVNLSIPRLAQLFKQQTGIPIRRYRLWHRLYLTAQHVGHGKNLTDAALEAGFTDSSHFNHTFKSMLGMTPSFILSQVKKTRIVI